MKGTILLPVKSKCHFSWAWLNILLDAEYSTQPKQTDLCIIFSVSEEELGTC